MSGIVSLVLSFSGVGIVLAAAAVWLQVRPSSRGARRLLVALAVGLAVVSTYIVPYWASRGLVAGYHQLLPTELPDGKTAIVVLGSSDYLIVNWSGESMLVPDVTGSARMWEAVRIFKSVRDGWVISSGGHSAPAGVPAPAITMRDAMIRAGVPAARIVVEDRSRNTRDEALLVAPLLHELRPDHVVLVTSDIHMRRSVGAFRAVGVAVLPAIARDPFLSRSWRAWMLPSTDGFEMTGRVVHEVGGIALYAALGWFRLA